MNCENTAADQEVQVRCSDGRPLRRRELRPERCFHLIAVPGGPSNLTGTLESLGDFSKNCRQVILESIVFFINVKGVRKIRLILHTDCGMHRMAGQLEVLSNEEALARELQVATQVVQQTLDERCPGIEVELRLGIEHVDLENEELERIQKIPFGRQPQQLFFQTH